MSINTVRSLTRCSNCRCADFMHFDDGCHTATGFICNCHLTRSDVLGHRADQVSTQVLTALIEDVNLVALDLDGTERSAVKVLTGFDDETIDDLGGLAEWRP